jgi:glycosyltransferase involved in cell wall biosynthesis
LALLGGSLRSAGAKLASGFKLSPDPRGESAPQIDLVHLHWLEFIAPSDRTHVIGHAKTVRRAWRLVSQLRSLRRRGIAVVWTIHNLAPHEPAHPRIENALARAVLATSDRAIVHSEHARSLVSKRFGHMSSLEVVPHGNYIGVYPATSSRSAERTRLGLSPGCFTYLAFGQVRRYKQLPELLSAFSALADPDVALVVAGQPKDSAIVTDLQSRAARDPRIRLDLRRIPSEEVASLHHAADAAVFPYLDMFSSGSALLALSCSLPIVVPASSTGTEVAQTKAVAAIGRDGLTAALDAIRAGDQDERRRAAQASAERYPWSEVARLTLEVYARALNDRRQATDR